MSAINLFSEPFDLDEIERVLQDDDFMALAHLTCGREANWQASVDQVARLLSIFEESERDAGPIYRMVSILVQRTAQLRDPHGRLEEAKAKFGLLGSASYWNNPADMLEAVGAPVPPAERDRRWLEEYHSKRNSR